MSTCGPITAPTTVTVVVFLLLAHIWCLTAAIDAKTDNIAHLRPTEQSTTFASGISALAVDGNPETCSVTERASIDNQRWWSVKLPGAVNVRDVAITINHGVAFLQQFTVFVIAKSGDLRTKFIKCASFEGIFRAGMRHVLSCPDSGIVGEKVYIRDDRREGSLSLCEVEVVAHSSGICSELPGIANGHVTVLGGTQQELRFHCDPGFLLLGSSDLKCMPDNTWSSKTPTCSQITCGYPHVEDANAVVAEWTKKSKKSMGATMGDEAMIMCNKGFQMVANHSSTTTSTSGQQGLEAIQDVRVICSQDGVWQRPFQYHCMDEEVHQELLAKMAPSTTSTSQTTSSFTTQSILYTLLSIVFFILLLLVLTLVLRRKRIKALRRRAEASVTLPRMHPDQGSVLKSSGRPLISIFTTLDNKCSSTSTTNLMQSQHSSSNAKLLTIDDDSLSRSQQQIHQSQPVVLKSSKKISYEEDLQLPESGSLVQGVSVDPNSAVFGRNGVRLEELERQFQNGLPDVTVGNYYHQHHLQQHQQLRPTPYLSSFQPATAAAAVPNPWQNSNHMGSIPPPPQPVRPTNIVGGIDTTNAIPPSTMAIVATTGSLPSSSKTNGIPRLFSVRSLNESVIMAPPPPSNFNTEEEEDTNGQLPELDEAGYASLIMRSNKSMEVSPSLEGGGTAAEPVYERIKGERTPCSQEVLLSNDNVSDSSDSHAYYSKVPKEELLQSLEPQRPPPLKEHLYQNFDQVFLEQHRHHHQQAHHPDLLNMSSKGINDDFYENTRSRSNHPEEDVVIVNDEKLRTMYAQVDVAKKHSERSHKQQQHQNTPLQVVDQVVQDLQELASMSASLPKTSPFSDVDLGSVHTAWEEHI